MPDSAASFRVSLLYSWLCRIYGAFLPDTFVVVTQVPLYQEEYSLLRLSTIRGMDHPRA
ncbi:hypothetical protein [Thiothrix eikelboomii]|uniref:hypothetical protein n=1 Tax=Thiothrix eikelboomii TaxID=92487 RepID=UPI003BAEFA6D